jgi:GNAT superfamily N-acetyltransferase
MSKIDKISIEPVNSERKRFIALLLEGDEQEDMIDRYLERGDMYVMKREGETVCVCVVTDEGGGVLEIKNIATAAHCRGKGYGRAMINFLLERYRGSFSVMRVGTGDSPLTVPFYEKCGFKRDFVVKNFFTDNYDHPIIEGGVQLKDMVYFTRDF